jgi:hypothetical protein
LTEHRVTSLDARPEQSPAHERVTSVLCGSTQVSLSGQISIDYRLATVTHELDHLLRGLENEDRKTVAVAMASMAQLLGEQANNAIDVNLLKRVLDPLPEARLIEKSKCVYAQWISRCRHPARSMISKRQNVPIKVIPFHHESPPSRRTSPRISNASNP